MIKRMTSAWFHGLCAIAIALLFLAVSPGSPVAVKTIEYIAVILDWPERPAVLIRSFAEEGHFWVKTVRETGERLRELELENSRLRSTLQSRPDISVPGPEDMLSCRVDVRSPTSWWKELRVNRGAADGIREGMPAIQGGFLVGRVSRVFQDHAWVELLTSRTLLIPVVVDETRDLGVMEGDGKGRISLLYIPEEKVLREGMGLSTALVSNLLPPGLPVGKISLDDSRTEGGFRVYRVLPGADFSSMYSLFIIAEEGI